MSALFNLGSKDTSAKSPSPAGDGDVAGPLTKDTSTQGFMADVIEASRDRLILVDFWAPWCGPCKQLTPVLEKVIAGYKGAVQLVKLNIDEHPMIPQQMGVQSIPAVFAFKDGRPLDGFMGALPESQVKQFIDRATWATSRTMMAGSKTRWQRQMQPAKRVISVRPPSFYGAVLAAEATNPRALGGLARCHIAAGNLEQAEHTLALATAEAANDDAISSARAALELAKKSEAASGELEKFRGRLASNPDDHEARLTWQSPSTHPETNPGRLMNSSI